MFRQKKDMFIHIKKDRTQQQKAAQNLENTYQNKQF
jgi:hypothetical protein